MQLVTSNHKQIGEKLSLFFFSELLPAQANFLPKGLVMLNSLKEICRYVLELCGCIEVSSSTYGLSTLWDKTCHNIKYAENIFKISDNYLVKPMNCPMHYIIAEHIYNKQSQLPLRIFEFNYCFRNEPSGSICGLFRLSRFTQDDSHHIVKLENAVQVIDEFFKSYQYIYSLLGIKKENIKVRLSKLSPEDYIGSKEQLQQATDMLIKYLNDNNIEYFEAFEGAFYGPKIDLIVLDSQNREWQTGTIQVDLCSLKNVDFPLKNEDNYLNTIVLHQAILGTFERFLGLLLENFDRIPKAINPYFLSIIVPSKDEAVLSVVNEIVENFQGNQDRVDVQANDSVSNLVKHAHEMQYEFYTVVGEKEVKSKKISIHCLRTKEVFEISTDNLSELEKLYQIN